MDDMTRHEFNAILELLKRHARAVTKKQLAEDIEAMQKHLNITDETEKTEAADDTPSK